MNRLAHESSPYLRQHADNPVEWYPWGEEAFAAARTRGLPILLSIGYSTCHWCHVMAHESFEDAAVAAQMNAHFINVKVDREERPDVDGVYMAAVQAMTGAGGWPMTVFLTPDGRPFYAGTYFPPHDAQGMPGFPRVLASVSGAWATQRGKLEQNAEALTEHVREASRPQGAQGGQGMSGALPADLIPQAVERLRLSFDARHGGFGRAPKFPSPTTLRFLLTQKEGREMALQTLRAMLAGGIHDGLGGGFHRYSVDERWLVPHFEKMLYDNAQLAQVLLLAWQVSGEAGFLSGARDTLSYLLREMQDAEGGFHSAQDADSAGKNGENVEGLYYTWTPDEVRAVLGEGEQGEADAFLRAYDISDTGHFLDPHRREYGRRSVPHLPRAPEAVAAELGLSPETLDARLEAARARLLAAREARVHPGTDDKVLTSWNGLMLAALADAARLTGEEAYLTAARRLRDFVDARMTGPGGALLHTFRAGEARVGGLLEDHAFWALGLLSLYQAGGEERDLRRARALWDLIRREYWDEELGAFAVSGASAEALIARRVEFFDAALPGAHPAAVQLAVWMARLFGDADAQAVATRGVQTFAAEMFAAPNGLGTLLLAAAHLQAPDTEVAVIGREREVLAAELRRHYLPFTVLALVDEAGSALPLLEERGPAPGGAARAYVCRGRACLLPTPDADVFARQLAELESWRGQ